MDWQQFGDTYILKLETHEELTRELKKFCIENGIKTATVSALGAVNSVALGFYNTQTQTYTEQSFHRSFELSSAIGTAETIDGELILHLHATISDKDFRTYGGHLFRAVTSKTIEIVLQKLN